MRTRLIEFLFLLMAVLLLNEMAFGAQPQPRGNRLIGHGISEGANGFGEAFALALDAGLEFIELPLAWDDVENAPGQYESKTLKIANAFFPAQGVKIFLTVNPIDTNNLRMPADLKNRAFDDPKVIARYQQLLDYVFEQTGDLEIIGFGIGNEIDAYLANDPSRWEQYRKFYDAARQYVKNKRPGLKVGTKAMMYGHIFHHTEALKKMNRNSDLIMVTYYPLKGGFRLREPAVVHEHFKRLTAIYKDRPISMLEAGYPSSSYLGSSEQKQAVFIRELFAAWDKHRDQVLHMNFMWLHDVPDSKLKEFETYYGFSSREFIEFLATLGLRTHNGEDKLAFNELKRQAQLRNWNIENVSQISPFQEKTPAPKSETKADPEIAATIGPEAIRIGFSKRPDLFHCATGSYVSLDYAGPRPDAISMRWNYRYTDDWLWCFKEVKNKKFNQVTKVSVWLKSDQKGPIFLRVDETDGESFFVITSPGLEWEKFEFYLTDFSVDDKTLQDGRIDPQKIASLILADPAAVNNKKIGIRTVWVSDFTFE